MSMEKDLTQYLKRQGYEKAAPEVLRVFKLLEALPAELHAIPVKVQQKKADYAALAASLEQAVKAAKHIERGLPPAPLLGADLFAVERQWRQHLVTVLESVKENAPKPEGGRPRNIGEEKLALAVMGALLRHGVSEQKIQAETTQCLTLLGMAEGSIERAVRAARKLTKPTPK